jgi:hypothetical protein
VAVQFVSPSLAPHFPVSPAQWRRLARCLFSFVPRLLPLTTAASGAADSQAFAAVFRTLVEGTRAVVPSSPTASSRPARASHSTSARDPTMPGPTVFCPLCPARSARAFERPLCPALLAGRPVVPGCTENCSLCPARACPRG